MKKFIGNKNGQGLVEYLILVALIAVGSLAVVRVVGQNVAKQYENINIALGAKDENRTTINNAPESTLAKKDLSNFLNGVRSENKKDNGEGSKK